MIAAIDRTRWTLRPFPRTLTEIAAVARRGGHPLHARVRLPSGWSDVFFDGATLLHAQVGWTLGHRALRALLDAEPFAEVHLQWHGTPGRITIDRPWSQLRAELAWTTHALPT